MNKLNVFKKPEYKMKFWEYIPWFFRAIKYAWQRATKGYCDKDTWDLDRYYTQLFIDTLTFFRDNSYGCPSEYYYENKDGYQTWIDTLNELINHFSNSLEEDEFIDYNEELEFENWINKIQNHDEQNEYLRREWTFREKIKAEKRKKELEKGMDLLKKVFFNLWD